MRVNFELDWISMAIGVSLAWLTFRVRKIFRLWKIKEESPHGLTVKNGEYTRVVNTLESLLRTNKEILGGNTLLCSKVDGIDLRVRKIEGVIPGLAQGNQ